MRRLLSERGIQLTKSLGQNFLHDGNQLRRMIKAAALGPGDKVLEIGPGLGPLTELLVEQAGEVLAVEKDQRLVEILRERLAGAKNLSLRHDDALEFLQRGDRDWGEWKLVSNLPYSVASPILVELAQSGRGPQRLVGTLQLEVARKLMAQAGDDDYGVLTLLVQLDYQPEPWFKIPASCFFPEPAVESACVVLERRSAPLLPEAERAAFAELVKRAFSQRRKMLIKLLRQDRPADRLERVFGELGLAYAVRAEAVSLADFVALTLRLAETRR